MAKAPAPQTAERAALLEAHQQHTAALATRAMADQAHDMAVRDYHGALTDVDDIAAQSTRPAHGHHY
jgi:hypothetical protein